MILIDKVLTFLFAQLITSTEFGSPILLVLFFFKLELSLQCMVLSYGCQTVTAVQKISVVIFSPTLSLKGSTSAFMYH